MARLSNAIGLAALGGALLAGCQLIAGVHNDAVLAEPDGGTDGGKVPCNGPGECGNGVCVDGFCCTATPSMEEVCANRCGQVQDECGRPFVCDDCVAPATCGADNTCACGPGCPVRAKMLGDGTAGMAGLALAIDGAGDAILTGDFFSTINFGGGTVQSLGNGDAFFAKLDPQGGALAARSFGAAGATQAGTAVAVDGAGHVVLAGSFLGTIDFGGGHKLTSTTAHDSYVVALDASNQHLWSTSFGSAQTQALIGVALDANGNALLAGNFTGNLDLGQGELAYVGGKDIYVAKLDASGMLLWGKSFGAADDQEVTGVAVDGDGNVLITGHFKTSIDFGGTVGASTAQGGSDAFVAKLDPMGAPLWAKALGDASEQHGYGIAAGPSGDILLTGGFQGTIDFGGGGKVTSPANDGVFVAKLDSGGNHVWSKAYSGDPTTVAHGRHVAFGSSGSVLVTGDANGALDFGGGVRPSYGGGFFVLRLDANGNHVWSRAFGGATMVQPPTIVGTVSDGVLVAGSFTGTLDLGFGPLTSNNGVANVFLLELSPF